MGNSLPASVTPHNNDSRKELNFSQQLTHHELCLHMEGQCSSKCLTTVPWDVLDSVWMYERLLASCNCLTALPTELPLRLPHLTFLDLNFNHITSLPDSIGLFIHLHTLMLRHNSLSQLPATVVHLRSLRKLDLSWNTLTELPAAIGNLPHLTKLNVANNQLTELPRSLGTCRSLIVLLAQGNSGCSVPPQELCDEGSSEAVIDYLRQLQRPNDVEKEKKDDDCPSLNVFPRLRTNDATSQLVNPRSPKSRYVQLQTQTTHTASRVRTPMAPPVGATAYSLEELADKVTGLIYGAIIGDALGRATEFMSPDECKFHYESDHLTYANIIQDEHTSHWKQGEWTSNSDQMLLVLDSVLHWAGMVDELDVAQRLIHWKFHGFADLDESEEYMLSETINEVLKKPTFRENPHSAARHLLRDSNHNGNIYNGNGLANKSPSSDCTMSATNSLYCDNGALPRAIVMGIIHFHNLKEVVSNSVRICLTTHADDRCVAACVFLSVLIALLLQGKYRSRNGESFGDLIKVVRDIAAKHLKTSDDLDELDRYVFVKDYKSIQLHERGKVNYTFKALAAAVLSFKIHNDMSSSLPEVILQGGHGSMNGCITGAVLGCVTGFSKVPKHWVEGLLPRNVQWLNSKINNLLDKMGLP